MMRSTFSSIFKMNVKQQFQYRTAAISGIVTQFFFGFMQIALFTAFLSQGESEFTVPQMASYIWLQQCFFTLFKYWDTCKPEISEKILFTKQKYLSHRLPDFVSPLFSPIVYL